jgi:hypothetical protein
MACLRSFGGRAPHPTDAANTTQWAETKYGASPVNLCVIVIALCNNKFGDGSGAEPRLIGVDGGPGQPVRLEG